MSLTKSAFNCARSCFLISSRLSGNTQRITSRRTLQAATSGQDGSQGKVLTDQSRRPFTGANSNNASFRQTIFACQNIPDLVRSASRLLPITSENAMSVLRRALDVTPAGTASPEIAKQIPPRLLNDLLSSVHLNMHVLSFEQLHTVVSFCLKFSLPADSKIWTSVERQIRFIMPKMDINQLLSVVKLFDSFVGLKNSTLPPSLITTLRDDLSKLLRERLSEVTKPADLLFALYKFSPPATPASVANSAAREVNDRLVGCVARLTPKQLYRAFYVQTRFESRHTPLLRAIAYYLRQPSRLDNLAPVHLLNILFSCAELNVTEPRLMKCVVDETKKRYKDYNAANLIQLARSAGTLQLRDADLLAKLLNSGLESKNKLLLADAIVAAGIAGIYPAKDQVKFNSGEILVDHLSDFTQKDPSLWLKLVWSLFALGHDKSTSKLESIMLPMFTDEYAQSLVNSVDKRAAINVDPLRNPATRRVRLQMANIRELLRLEHPQIYSKIPPKPNSVLAIPIGDCRIRADRPQFDLCFDTFSTFCDAKKYVTMDKPTEGGVCIDFVVYVEKSGELVPTESHLNDTKDTNITPVAIKVCEFAEQTLLETQPNGLANLHARMFKSLGYRPVILTTAQLTRSMPIAQRAQNLQDMIKKNAAVVSKQQ